MRDYDYGGQDVKLPYIYNVSFYKSKHEDAIKAAYNAYSSTLRNERNELGRISTQTLTALEAYYEVLNRARQEDLSYFENFRGKAGDYWKRESPLRLLRETALGDATVREAHIKNELHSWFPTLNIAYVSNVIDDTKYHNVDNLAAADMIAYPVLDVASVGLSFVGFDFIPEGLGVLYSAYRKDAGNTAIYSASMIFAFGSSPAFRLADELVAVKNLDAEDALYKRLNEVGESDEVLAYTASTSTAEIRSLTRSEANELSTKVLNYKDLKGTVVNLGSDLDNARLWLGSVSDGRAYVIVHSTGTEFKVLHNGQEVLLSHRSLARWIESKGLGSQEIVLLSCNDAATAQKLANKLPNAKIGSWSGEVRLFDNGFVEGDGSYKLYQKNTPPATITTPPNGGKTSKPQNGKMVRLGDEVVSGGRPANFLATLDKLHLTSLKSKLNQLDASTKAKFLDDFADASDDVLRQLDADLDLVDVWKGLGDDVITANRIDVEFLGVIKKITNDPEFYLHIEGEIASNQVGGTDPTRGGRGGHTEQAITDGKIRYSQYTGAPPNKQNPPNIATTTDPNWYNSTTGVRRAFIEVYDARAGVWKFKETAASTFFPKSWRKQRIIEEIASAINHAKANGKFGNIPSKNPNLWEGVSTSGLTIQGYKSTSLSGLATSWPVL